MQVLDIILDMWWTVDGAILNYSARTGAVVISKLVSSGLASPLEHSINQQLLSNKIPLC